MAVRWAIASGAFSSTATWNDGATLGIPTTGDDVYANNFTVNMDVNATVNSLNNSALAAQSTRLNPVMTSNTAPSGVASASSNVSNAWLAFNGGTGTAGSNIWNASATAPQWVQYQFASSLIVRSYSIYYSGLNAGRPVNFNLQGSNDGVSFTTLDTRTSFVFTNDQYNTLTITNPTTAYSYYRLNVTATDTGNPSVVELTFNEAGVTTTAGGSFNFNTAGVTVTCTSPTASLSAGAANLITTTATTGTVTLTTASSFTTNFAAITHTGNCNFNITALNLICGGSNILITKSSTGTITINSNMFSVQNVTNTSNVTVLSSSNGNTVVNGNIYGGYVTNSGSGNIGIIQTSGNITVTGNVYGGGGLASTNYGINFSGTGNIIVNGNVYGGHTSNGIFTSLLTTINGNVYAQGVASIGSTSANTITVTGDVYASATANGISSTNASGVVNLTGNMYNALGRNAIYCQNVFISNTATTLWRTDTGGGDYKFLYSADTTPNLPATTNVRFGTTFGPALSLTGTMVVLANSDVRKDVPNDNSVGTAELTSADIISGINASSDPLAVRLKNALTDVTAGNIISQYKDS